MGAPTVNPVIASTLSVSSCPTVTADTLAVLRTLTSPEVAFSDTVKVGCVVTLTPVRALAVVAVPRAVIAFAVDFAVGVATLTAVVLT